MKSVDYVVGKVEMLEKEVSRLNKEVDALSKQVMKAAGFIAAIVFFTNIISIYIRIRGKI